MKVETRENLIEERKGGLLLAIKTCLRWWVCLLPPIIVFLSMMFTFSENGLYPYGGKTISWCDMEQQVIPLLLQCKDVLAGKENFFFSLKNAGGMNFYGVFFFFLASPFTFLVAFVDKADMPLFCNVLVALKMGMCALTASLYFAKKKSNARILNVALSTLYAYSGYVMMYYQNVMWLDVAYLFPLLLWGLENLQKGKRRLFIFSLCVSMTVNYYLGYMLVVFLLLYALVWTATSKDKKFAFNFVISCIFSALITAMVWLPSLWQYLGSGRGNNSIIEGLRNSSLLTHVFTTVPTVLSTLFLFPFALSREGDKDRRLRQILFLATLAPIFFEPINKMWQTGNYMSFPTRYAFITIFLCLSLAFDSLANKEWRIAEPESKIKPKTTEGWVYKLPMYLTSAGAVLLSLGYYLFSTEYVAKNVETLDQYSHSLWGNAQSYEGLLTLYMIALIVGVILYMVWRFRLLKPFLLWTCVVVMVASELYIAPMTYMLTPAHDVEWYQQVVELADQIEDEDFYRVKTDKSYSSRDFDVNLLGGLGYNSLGHYTSLTGADYMQTIKNFGYTSYWMEVGNSGGTVLTDALLSVKYQISSQRTAEDVYNGSYFHISKTPYTLPLGIVAKGDILREETLTRGGLQKRLYNDFFDGNGVTVYEMKDANAYRLKVEEEDGKYVLTPTGSLGYLSFDLTLEENSLVYVNVFDENTNALKQAINEKFIVRAPGYSFNGYPQQKNNGLLKVGKYEAGEITVKIEVKEPVSIKEVEVVTIDAQKLASGIATAKSLHLQANNEKIVGRYEANGGEQVFLSVPYDEGLQLKINGESAKLYKAYDGFTAFYLEEGINEIEITFLPRGFSLGVGISVGGMVAFIGYSIWIALRKRKGQTEGFDGLQTLAYFGVLAVGILTVFLVYVAPMFLCAL